MIDLATYVGTDPGQFITDCENTAGQLVGDYVKKCAGGADPLTVVPQDVLLRAQLEVAAELYNRKNAPNGIAQFASFDGQSPVRIARDPMQAAYALLNPYLVVGF